jgi:GDP-4-dehydro-6-deoxy-D-mannose reductase
MVLGAGGFVGAHLIRTLAERMAGTAEIHATSQRSTSAKIRALDILDGDAVEAALIDIRPTHVINLAGIAAPVIARRNRDLAWKIHCTSVETLGLAILRHLPETWLFNVGSGLVYGHAALHRDQLGEDDPLVPTDPYTVTKAAGDLAVGALAFEGLKCLRLRPFNHIGPGQSPDFVVPAFASQLADVKEGRSPPVVRVGNLEAERDFLDVRDVADAYVTLIEQSHRLAPGEAYNISSGAPIKISVLLDRLIALTGLDVEIKPDPDRQRPSDIPRVCGSSAKLTARTGWRPQHDIDATLRDVLSEFLTQP